MSFEAPVPPYTRSDPTSHFVNTSAFDLLLIELVPLSERLAHSLVDRDPHPEARTPLFSAHPSKPTSDSATTAAHSATSTSKKDDLHEDLLKDQMFFRLDGLGFRVGQGLAERFSRDRPRFSDDLDVIKFLCKDIWGMVFGKQIDNLKTNHRGIYVLTDNKFKPFSRMSMTSWSEALARAQPYLWFPCGIIRGVLSSLGIDAKVQAETAELPLAIFQIKSSTAKT